jgi:DNA (cytosine-5)-methyltransferase 1
VTTNRIFPTPKRGKKPTVRDYIGKENGFADIPAGHIDATKFLHSSPSLSETCLKRIQKVPKDGGNRMAFANDEELQLKCFIGKDSSFKDTFGRLWWNRPAPTITTKFYSVSNGRFVHPDNDRALSLREGATLQSFPKNYKFFGTNNASIARLIGNAVPPEYAKRIGCTIIKNHKNAV